MFLQSNAMKIVVAGGVIQEGTVVRTETVEVRGKIVVHELITL